LRIQQPRIVLINATIEEYLYGTHYNHKAKSERKLLLNKKELKKLEKDSDNKGLTIVPLRLFTNEKGLAKIEIALCRGKKNYDKRETLKEKDTQRDLDRVKKRF
jgi:SsrA-binding protein